MYMNFSYMYIKMCYPYIKEKKSKCTMGTACCCVRTVKGTNISFKHAHLIAKLVKF